MRAGYDLQLERVDTLEAVQKALDTQLWDVIISDYVMPNFSAPAALQLLKQRGLDVPFIIVSGAIGEETAVAAMRAGAHDYLMKDNLARLAPVIERELQDHLVRRDRKRAEEALRNSEKLATLGRMAATIAHEVNNPLEAVTNVLYLLGCCKLDPEAREYVKLAQQELDRVTLIVRQALSFSRNQTDHVAAPVSQLVEQVLQLYAPRIQGGQVELKKRFEFDAAVPGELRQVFSNLIVNAVDAVDGGGKVQLHILRAREPGALSRFGIRFVIADNGVGIQPEYRRDIFAPFFSTKQKGNGLGLWISKEIVQKHGGSIRVRSSVRAGRSGTVFSVFVPLHDAASAAHHSE
jgi:signal transduction histidine kinase